FARRYRSFRLDQAPDFVGADPDAPGLPEERRTELRQLGPEVFAWSDLGFIGIALLLWARGKWFVKDADADPKLEHMYGWAPPTRGPVQLRPEPPLETGIPIPAHAASRADSLRISTGVGAARASATLTQVMLVDEDGTLGWLFSLRGAVAFDEKAGTKQRPV